MKMKEECLTVVDSGTVGLVIIRWKLLPRWN